jgi:hypothetical protein
MFEVETLKYATLATVSRCGMVWFSEDTVTSNMMVSNYLDTLRTVAFEDLDEDAVATGRQPPRPLPSKRKSPIFSRHSSLRTILSRMRWSVRKASTTSWSSQLPEY